MRMHLSKGSSHDYYFSWINVAFSLKGSNGVCVGVVAFVFDGRGGDREIILVEKERVVGLFD